MTIYDLLDVLSTIGPYAFYLALIVTIFFVVMFIHEIGHFLAARAFAMPVKSVVIGRGKILKNWQSQKGTRWELCMLPFGAHVHLAGMREETDAGDTNENAFHARPYWQRMIVLFAGPAINIATPFILFPLFYMSVGQPSSPPIIAGIEIGLASDDVGLEPGDRFLSMSGKPFATFKDVWDIAYARGATENIYKIQRGAGVDKTIYDIAITPGWEKYDDDGITRANARFCINWTHTPYDLETITSVAGTDTTDDEDLARALLIKHLDSEVIIGLKSVNGKSAPFRFRPKRDYNYGLFDQNDDHYEAAYLGTEQYNFYRKRPIGDAFREGIRTSASFVKKVASIPFQLLPVDPTILRDAAQVSDPQTPIINEIYKTIYKLSLVSVFLALINLVPFPGLDGGHIMIATAQKCMKKPMSRKIKARFFAIGFMIVYAAIALANLDNLPRYIDSSMKKLQKFSDQK
jgi:membrane-associated protease RseP (regulator of RpoE activity)